MSTEIVDFSKALMYKYFISIININLSFYVTVYLTACFSKASYCLSFMIALDSRMDVDARGLILSCPNCGKRNRMAYERLGQTFRCGECHNGLLPPSEPIEVRDEKAFEALIGGSALPVLVDFWAPWCGPCKMVAPEVSKVAAQGAGRWLAVKVNTEELPGLAQQFEVSAIPLVVVFKNGRELARQAGAMPAQRIRSFVEQAL